MHDRSGIIRLVIASICCLTVIIYSGYDIFLYEATSETIKNFNRYPLDYNNSDIFSPIVNDTKTESTSSAVQATPQTPQSSSSQTVTAGSSGTVAGKVVERFISPYTANTSYNGIYLKNSTNLNIDLKAFYEAKLPYTIEKNGKPQVLIMHTHTTESFLHETRDYYTDTDAARTLDEEYNMVKLGNIITDKLNAAGITTLHDTTTHDYPQYNGSYTRSAATINSYLKKYPDIKIVIDLHRDAIAGDGSDKVKPVVEINGKKAAQVMLVMGSQSGSVTNHSKWQENLKLAVKLQRQLEGMYPTLARSLSLVSKIYNQNLTTGSMLIEIGTEVNSMEEVMYSAELVGNALIGVLA